MIIELENNIGAYLAKIAVAKIFNNRSMLNDCDDNEGVIWVEKNIMSPNNNMKIIKNTFNNFSVTFYDDEE